MGEAHEEVGGGPGTAAAAPEPAATPRRPRPTDPYDDPGSMRAAAVAGVRWNVVSLVGRQILRLLFNVVLARMLGPGSYGIVAQGIVVMHFLLLFQDQGLGASLVQRRNLTRADVGTVFWVNVGASLLLAGVLVAGAPAAAAFFDTDELEAVLRVLAVSVVVTGFAVVPRALLARRLDFRAVAVAEVAGAVLGGIAGITAALLDAGYWAFVVQLLVNDAVATLLFLVAARMRTLRGTFAALRGLWGFSSQVMAFQALNYGSRNIDNVLVGRFLGPVDLAFYAISYRIMMVPVQNIGQVVNRVAFPVYARVQGHPRRMRTMFVTASGLLALAAVPAMLLVVVGAPLAVPLVFGDEWDEAIVPMQILAATGLRQSVVSMTGPLFLANGRADLPLRTTLVSTVALGIAFAIGLQFGIVGVALAYTIVSSVADVVLVYLGAGLIGLRIRRLLAELVPAAAGGAALVAGWYAATVPLHLAGAGDAVELGTGALAALLAYAATIWFCFRGPARDALTLVREAVRGGGEPVSPGPPDAVLGAGAGAGDDDGAAST